jgi:hypothetical protein
VGLYTAPTTLAANQSYGGYQLFPNDHIFNVNIASLPADTSTINLTIDSTATPGVSRDSTGTVTLLYVDNGVQPPAGSIVTVTGVADSSFNGTVTIIHEGGCTGNPFSCFTYANAGPVATSGGGTVAVPINARLGPNKVQYLESFPNNYMDNTTPTDSLVSYHNPANNGTYQVPQWPKVGTQQGWFSSIGGDFSNDHHMMGIDTTNGNLTEIYHYTAEAPITSCTVNSTATSVTCTITTTKTSSGFSLPNTPGHPTCTYPSQVKGCIAVGTFAGGDIYLNGTWTLSSATLTSVTFTPSSTTGSNLSGHGGATTSTTGFITMYYSCTPSAKCNVSSALKYTYADYTLPVNGSTDAAGMALAPLTLHSDELDFACANSVPINHALRMTMSNSYIAPSHIWPATLQATPPGTVPYGTRMRLKSSFVITGFSACAQILLTQLQNYGVYIADGGSDWEITTDYDNTWPIPSAAMKEINTAAIPVQNWEAVNETSLMETSTSGATNTGEVVTYSATGVSPASTNVNLQGTAVNLNTNQFYIMAGTPTQQLIGYSAGGGITWTMSPTVGTLTSGGLYTPPVSVSAMTTTTVTATSTVNSSVAKQMIVYVLPTSDFRLIQGTANYTDSLGNVWNSGGAFGIGMSNTPSWQGCCQTSNAYSGIDKQLYSNHLASSQTSGDYKMDFHVPNGVYKIMFNNGTSFAAGANIRNFYIQGVPYETIDNTAIMGGLNLNYYFSQTTLVTNNILSIYQSGIGYQADNLGDISSISISAPSPLPVWLGLLNPTYQGACNPASILSPQACGIDWTAVGVVGGIPPRATICATAACSTVTTNAGASTPAQIQAAINSCPAGDAVLLPTGSYTLSADLTLISNCTLRGSGTLNTILTYTGTTGFPISAGGHNSGSVPNMSNAVTITSGALAGSTSMFVSSTTNLAAGGLMVVTEFNDPVYVSINTPNGTCNSCDAFLFHNAGTRVRGQTVKITSIQGNSVNFTPPLYTNYGTATSTGPAVAVPFGASTGSAPVITGAGVENLQLFMTNSSPNSSVNGSNISLRMCDGCWVKGVFDNYSDSDHVDVDYCYRCEVRDSYFTNSFIHTSGGSDADVAIRSWSSGVLVENNIMERLHSSSIFEWGMAGNVYAYNYSCCSYDQTATNVLDEDVVYHGASPQLNLFEGNIMDNLNLDAFWGSGTNTTAFRNQARATSTIAAYAGSGAYTGRANVGANGAINWAGAHLANQQNRSFSITFQNTNFNAIGNVAGSADAKTVVGSGNLFNGGTAPYTMNVVPPGNRVYDTTFYAFNYGYNTGFDTNGSSIASFAGGPSNTAGYWVGLANTTKFQHGNFDMASNSIVWVPGVTQTLPASFYKASKPSWFGSVPWPAIGPDITSGTVDASVLGGHVNAIPAMVCYNSTARNADGIKMFDPNACYAGPLPPTNLGVAPATGMF